MKKHLSPAKQQQQQQPPADAPAPGGEVNVTYQQLNELLTNGSGFYSLPTQHFNEVFPRIYIGNAWVIHHFIMFVWLRQVRIYIFFRCSRPIHRPDATITTVSHVQTSRWQAVAILVSPLSSWRRRQPVVVNKLGCSRNISSGNVPQQPDRWTV